MTYLEMLMWFCDFLKNTVIPTINNNAEAVKELQNLFTTLKNYVDNYFENLDVQKEINHKLDEMVKDGTLEQIMIPYFNQKPYYFNSVAEMKAYDLKVGDMAITLGYYSANDGGGAEYLVRNRTNDDVEDNGSIHFINNNLVACLITNHYYPEIFGCKGDGLTNDTTCFLNLINFLYSHSRYNRIIELLPDKIYLLSEPIPINHSLTIKGKSKNSNSTIKNITTNIFYVPEENCINDNGTLKIWSYYFENIVFIGSDENFFLTGDSYQHWGTRINNCTFNNFNKIFENLNLYISHYNENSFNTIAFGKLHGSDNIIENLVYTGKELTENRPTQAFEFENLYLTRILKCYMTGSLTSETGCKNIINLKNCRDIIFSDNWFDYCDCSAIFINECNFVNITNNTFRGCSRIPEGNYQAYIEIKGSKNVNVCENSFLNHHIGTQNNNAKAYRIWDYNGFISENIIIKNNKYEINYFYSISLTNKTLTKGVVIDEPSVYNNTDTNINMIQKYSINNSNSNGIFYNQDNFDNIVCSGTSTANTSIYINGSYNSSNVLFTLIENKTYKAKINDIYTDIQLALFNESTLIKILSNNEDYTPSQDTEITGVAIFIQNNKTYYFAKTKPQLFLVN